MDPAPAGGFIAGANKPVLVAVDQRTSVTEVCLPSRLHSVSPCRTSHSSSSRSTGIGPSACPLMARSCHFYLERQPYLIMQMSTDRLGPAAGVGGKPGSPPPPPLVVPVFL